MRTHSTLFAVLVLCSEALSAKIKVSAAANTQVNTNTTSAAATAAPYSSKTGGGPHPNTRITEHTASSLALPAASTTGKESPAKASHATSTHLKNTETTQATHTTGANTSKLIHKTSKGGKGTTEAVQTTSKVVGGGQTTESKAPVKSQTYGGDTSSPADHTTVTYSYNPQPTHSSHPEGIIGQSRTHAETTAVTTDDTTAVPPASSQPVLYSTQAAPTITFSYNPAPAESSAADAGGQSAYPPAGTSTYATGHSTPPYESQQFSFAPGGSQTHGHQGVSQTYGHQGATYTSGAAAATESGAETTFAISYNPHATSGRPGHPGTWSQSPEAGAVSSTQSYVPYITKALKSSAEAAQQSLFTFHGHTYHIGGATLNAQASSTAKSTETNPPSLASGAGSNRGLPSCSWAVLGVVVGGAALL